MNKLLIYGASGHGKVVGDIAISVGWKELEFYDDQYKNIPEILNRKVKGDWQSLCHNLSATSSVFIAIGNNYNREKYISYLIENNASMVSLIHSSAIISERSTIGIGSVVMPNVVVNAYSEIGVGSILNTASSVDHDCRIDNFVHMSPGARLAGGVDVGRRSWLGLNSSVIENVKIGDDVIVGAGAVVLNNIEDGKKVVGVPAREIGGQP